MIGDSHFPFHSQIVKGTSRGGGPVVKVMFFDKLKEELFLNIEQVTALPRALPKSTKARKKWHSSKQKQNLQRRQKKKLQWCQ